MQSKKIIRFVQSFVLLPIVSMSMPLGNLAGPNLDVVTTSKIVFLQKQNTELVSSNSNKDEETEAQILKAQAEAIDSYYAKYNMPLKGMGMKMAIESKKNGLDWRLIPAISVIESTGGKHSCQKVTNSFLGWGSCKINFESKDKAVEIVAWNLGGNNPNTDHHYEGKTTGEIIDTYNPPSIVPNYKSKIFKVMNSIGVEQITEEHILAKANI